MFRRLFFPLVLGLSGVGVLLWLGMWQLQRLDWKRGILHEIETRIAAPAVPLPIAPTEAADEYMTVRLAGHATGAEIHVLSSGTEAGTGYRVISAFETDDGRKIMVDQGILPLDAKQDPVDTDEMTLEGNLSWPDDKTASTPEPDLPKNIWFARDVPAMAQVLQTEPLLVVMRAASRYDSRLTPVALDTSGIKNDHREYAITWFLLAAVWAMMTGFLIVRTLRQKD